MRGKAYIAIGIIFLSLGVIFAAEVAYPSEVSINIFSIIYDKFDGATTDFNSFNESMLRDLPNVVLEIVSFGKVEFGQNLDIVSMGGDDYTVDFNANVNISDNLAVVDAIDLPGIGKPAVISLRGIDFEDPIIHKNGAVCSACNKISYSSGVFKFSVPAFDGAFYLRENPDLPVCGNGVCEDGENKNNCPSDCDDGGDDGGDTGGGGGGGGGGGTPGGDVSDNKTDPYAGIYDFKINPTLLDARVRKGSYFQKEITVENNGSRAISLGISIIDLEDFIFPQVDSFSLEPGESRKIRFDIYVSNSQPADVYLGKIKFYSSYRQRSADFVLQVKEREALFDIRTEVLKKYVTPGGRVRANVSLINMGDLRNFDVNLDYMVLDFEKNNYTIKSEQFAINKTYSNVFFLDVPEDIPLGNYIFYTTVSYGKINATSYDTFTTEKISYFSWIILMIIILVLMYLVVRWYRERKAELIAKLAGKGPKRQDVVYGSEKIIPVEEELPLLP